MALWTLTVTLAQALARRMLILVRHETLSLLKKMKRRYRHYNLACLRAGASINSTVDHGRKGDFFWLGHLSSFMVTTHLFQSVKLLVAGTFDPIRIVLTSVTFYFRCLHRGVEDVELWLEEVEQQLASDDLGRVRKKLMNAASVVKHFLLTEEDPKIRWKLVEESV